jgi:hypothetical protein
VECRPYPHASFGQGRKPNREDAKRSKGFIKEGANFRAPNALGILADRRVLGVRLTIIAPHGYTRAADLANRNAATCSLNPGLSITAGDA